jgi:hypothetical protein
MMILLSHPLGQSGGLFWSSAGTFDSGIGGFYVAYQPYTAFLDQIMNPETSAAAGIRLTHIYYSYGYPPIPFAEFYLWDALTLFLLVTLAGLLARRLR